MFFRITNTALLFIVSCFHALSQSTYNFKHLTIHDGLSDAKVGAIVQDKYGNMWFSALGLNRYNGYTMEVYTADVNDSTTLPDLNVRRMFCSRSGNLYISTLTGFCRYDYARNNFQRLPFRINNRDSRIYETEDGVLWMNSDKGLVIVDEKRSTYTELAKHTDTLIRKIARYYITDFVADGKENIYLATRAGLHKLNYKTWQIESYQNDKNNPASLKNNDVQNAEIDRNGIIWLSTGYYGSSLVKFDPLTKTFSYFEQLHTLKKDWADNRILNLLIDSRDRLWIATLRSSLALYTIEQNKFDFFLHDPLEPASISSNTIYTLYEDRDGAIWLSSLNSGIDYFIPDNHFFSTISKSSFHTPSLVDKWCQSVTEDKKGNLWIGTNRGLSYYNRELNNFTNYLLAQQESQEANNSIRALLADDDGTIWIGTGNGLNRWNPGTQKITPVNTSDSLPAAFINYLMLDREKNLWVCSPAGLFRYNRTSKKFQTVLNQQALSPYRRNRFFSICQDSKGRYWISLSLAGLLIYDERKQSAEYYDFKKLNPESLANDYITSFAEDASGIMWMSSHYGLIGFDYDTKKIKQYYTSDGLPSGKTSCLQVDSLNRLWIGTSKGLCMFDSARKNIRVYDGKDGLTSGYFYEGSSYKISNGYFAYPTYNGLLVFRPTDVKSKELEMQVHISSFKVLGKEKRMEIPVEDMKKIQLRYNENFFAIEMTAFNYSDPSKIRYAYLLEGFDKEWIYTNERIVNYTNVPGGKYVFRYKITDNAANWNVPEQQFEIFISTVFYKTWWFLSLAVLLLGSLVYLFVRFRFMQQQRVHALENRAQSLEKEKALVMYENLKQHLNPHFLFNSLTSLRSLIRVDQKNAGDFLERMSKIYRYILKSRDSELVQLKDEINFVQTYIELQKTRFREGLQVKFNINDEHLHLRIVPVTLQNLIDNAIKHNLVDEETPLIVEIFVEEDYLVVRNNLQKKEFVETSNKQGLQNMRSLYHYLDSRPVIINEDQNYFTIKIPLI